MSAFSNSKVMLPPKCRPYFNLLKLSNNTPIHFSFLKNQYKAQKKEKRNKKKEKEEKK
jgi:hypothetical protein